MTSIAWDQPVSVELLTAKEVADVLRVSHAHVLKLARAGEIPAVKLGKAWRFRKDVIEQMLEEARW